MMHTIQHSYTKEELDVFRECFVLLKQGCKNNTEAEKKLGIKFWNIPRSKIYSLVKIWFFHREKIDAILAQQDTHTQIKNESNESNESNKTNESGNALETIA